MAVIKKHQCVKVIRHPPTQRISQSTAFEIEAVRDRIANLHSVDLDLNNKPFVDRKKVFVRKTNVRIDSVLSRL
jgi:hypothetical protein